MRLTRKFKQIWNGFFLLLALFFIGLVISVIAFSKTVDQFGQNRITNYVTAHRMAAEQALLSLNQGNTYSVEEFLKRDLVAIKKGDRLYPLKRKLLLALVSQLKADRKKASWVYWAKYWYKLDKRDVTAMVYYFSALMQNDSDYQEGAKGLERAAQLFPEHPLLKNRSLKKLNK